MIDSEAQVTARDFAAYDSIATSVFTLALDTTGVPRYTAMNRRALLLRGMEMKDIVGKTAIEVAPDASGHVSFNHQILALREGKEVSYETCIDIGGTRQHMKTTLLPVLDQAGSVSHLVGTEIEIAVTHPDQAAPLPHAGSAPQMEQFVALAAHDLRTPMRNIAILAAMLRDGFQDHGDGKMALIDMLDDVAQKTGRMITDVLDYAQSVTAIPREMSFDLGGLCRTMGKILDPQGQHRIIAPDTKVIGDELATQIILRNLFDNAIKHGGKPHMTISVEAEHADANRICITVVDDGLGFSNPGKVFLADGKFRADSGYGLLGIRRLLLARGGTINVETTRGHQGSSVSFTMPGAILPSAGSTSDAGVRSAADAGGPG